MKAKVRPKILPLPPLPNTANISQRLELGKSLRDKTPRHAHAVWHPRIRRRDPIEILIESNQKRIPELLPIRYGRMVQSPFTFFRGAAAVMASDLSQTPVTRIFTQICGDCHLLNFGGFGTPERKIIFDLNDFDETLFGPWEWDLKRLATSFVLASRHNGFSKTAIRKSALVVAKNYRKYMAEFSTMSPLEVWYAHLDVETILASAKNPKTKRDIEKRIDKALHRDVLEDDYPKLAESSHGKHRIKENPPLIYHLPEAHEADFKKNLNRAYELYRKSLPDDRRLLLDHYAIQDIAMKVVGVGSVGTWCGIVLHMSRNRDPLFLQVKEAQASVLEPYVGVSSYPNHGQRVVVGQRLMQAASDIFLGWTQGRQGRNFYVRQLRDKKIKPQVEIFHTDTMHRYAKFCGWVLARAHAKSGDSAMISGYLGDNDHMDEALADFAEAYADQSEQDHQVLLEAVNQGRIPVYLER